MSIWDHISQQITQTTGQKFTIEKHQGVGGGCINETTRVTDGDRSYFIKINHISHGDMFEAEAQGLKELAESRTLRVPGPVCYGNHGQQCYIVMEYLPMNGSINMELVGQQFAAMHTVESAYGDDAAIHALYRQDRSSDRVRPVRCPQGKHSGQFSGPS